MAQVNKRKATSSERAQFQRYANAAEVFSKKSKSLWLLLATATATERKVRELAPLSMSEFTIVTPTTRANVVRLKTIADKMMRQLKKVNSHDYGVQFIDGQINIVSGVDDAESRKDVIRNDDLDFGFAVTTTIIIVTGIVSLTVLASGDNAVSEANAQANVEAARLQRAMVEADREMMRQPEKTRTQWEAWRKQTANIVKDAVKNVPKEASFLDRFAKSAGTVGGIASAVAIGLLAFRLIPKPRRESDTWR
jgi:hypothetical protein